MALVKLPAAPKPIQVKVPKPAALPKPKANIPPIAKPPKVAATPAAGPLSPLYGQKRSRPAIQSVPTRTPSF